MNENQIGYNKNSSINSTSTWGASSTFQDIQRIYGIPKDPTLWSVCHVSRWLSWAKEQFALPYINPSANKLNGATLCLFSAQDFHREIAPYDKDHIFYKHFQILRKTHIVAILYKNEAIIDHPILNSVSNNWNENDNFASSSEETFMHFRDVSINSDEASSSRNNCPVAATQLWQFLLLILVDPKFVDLISWFGSEGKFKFHKPEAVAKLWGDHKGKNNMNYSKLSRSLRYYYEKSNLLSKVDGHIYAYKFNVDLRDVLGYSSTEIQQQIQHAIELKRS